MRRGSITTNAAPRRRARLMRAPTTGCASVGFAPATTMHEARSRSVYEADAAPVPVTRCSASAVEAWHTRAQQSTLLVPITVRKSFCSR
jgi:hypothetical protein